MPIRKPPNSRASIKFLAFCVFLSCLPGCILSAIVTLDSIEIYNTHELLKAVNPIVYFKCKGENKTMLPDVKEKHALYKFNGQESWQPLTEVSGRKCKRCGLYEEDTFKTDDKFDEWELCPSDFDGPDGKYIRFKDKEFNATFVCSKCVSPSDSNSTTAAQSHKEEKGKGLHIALVILIVVAVLAACIFGAVVAYKYWQKKKRQQDQARFLKLFEDGDDIEDELGLDHVI